MMDLRRQSSDGDGGRPAPRFVYPCCIKTRRPIGNLVDEPLIEILDSLVGELAFEASDRSSRAHRPRPRLKHRGLSRALADTHAGRKPYANLCIGCDAFHEEMLGPVVDRARDRRCATRAAAE
jgi:hypothetical protein